MMREVRGGDMALEALAELEERGGVLIEIHGEKAEIRVWLDEFDQPTITLANMRDILEATAVWTR